MAGIQVQFDTRQAQAAVRALASDLNSLDRSFTDALQGAGKLTSQMKALSLGSAAIGSSLKNLETNFNAPFVLANGFGVVEESLKYVLKAITAVVETGIGFDRYEKQMVAVAGSANEAAKAWDYLWAVSDRLGLEIDASTESFISLAAAAKRSGLDIGTAKEMFSSYSEAAVAAGLSTDNTKRMFNELSRLIDGGNTDFQVISKSIENDFNVTLQNSNSLIDSMVLHSKNAKKQWYNIENAVISSSQSQSAELNRQSNEVIGLEASLNRLGNAWTKLKNETYDGTKRIWTLAADIATWFTVGMADISENLNLNDEYEALANQGAEAQLRIFATTREANVWLREQIKYWESEEGVKKRLVSLEAERVRLLQDGVAAENMGGGVYASRLHDLDEMIPRLKEALGIQEKLWYGLDETDKARAKGQQLAPAPDTRTKTNAQLVKDEAQLYLMAVDAEKREAIKVWQAYYEELDQIEGQFWKNAKNKQIAMTSALQRAWVAETEIHRRHAEQAKREQDAVAQHAAEANKRETQELIAEVLKRGEALQASADAYQAGIEARSVVTREQEEEGTRLVRESREERKRIIAGYVDETNQLTMDEYSYRRQQLEAWLKAEIDAHGESRELLALYGAKSMKLAEEEAEFRKEQYREAALAGEDFAAGMAVAFQELSEEAYTFGQAGYDAIMEFAQAGEQLLSDVFGAAMKGELDSLTDAWRGFTDSLVRMYADAFAKMAMQELVLPSLQGLFGGSTSGVSAGEIVASGQSLFSGAATPSQAPDYLYGWERQAWSDQQNSGGSSGWGEAIGSSLAYGGLGAGIGGMAGEMMGGESSGYAQMAGTVAGAAASLIAMTMATASAAGPIGMAVGAIVTLIATLIDFDNHATEDLDLTFTGSGPRADHKGDRKSYQFDYGIGAGDWGQDFGSKLEGEKLEKATIAYLDEYFLAMEEVFDIDLNELISGMDINFGDIQDKLSGEMAIGDLSELMLTKLMRTYTEEFKGAIRSSEKGYATQLVAGFEDIADGDQLKEWIDRAIPAIRMAEEVGDSIADWMQDFGLDLGGMLSELPADAASSFQNVYGAIFDQRTGLEQQADEVNAQFDQWVEDLKGLGVDEAFIAGIEAMRQDVIDAMEQELRDAFAFDLDQREMQATGRSGEAAVLARRKSQEAEYDAAVKQFGEGSEEVARLLRIQALENEALARTMADSITIYAAQVAGNAEGAAWLQLQADHQQKWNEAVAAGISGDQLDILRQTMELENQLFAEQYAFAQKERETNLQVRLLRAQGDDAAADALALQLEQEREILTAKQEGWSAEQVALLEQVHAAEDLQAAAEAAQQAAADAEAAFKSMQDAILDLQGKFLELGFDPGQAMQGKFVQLTGAQRQRAALELQLAREYEALLDSGVASQSIFKAFGDYEKLARQALEAAIAQEKARAMEDLEVRRLQARGEDEAAEALQYRLQLEREYQDAVAAGQDADQLARLREVQAYELLEWAQDRQAEKIEELAQAYRDAADSLADTIRDLTYSEELSTLDPGEKLARLQAEFDALSAKALAGDAEAMAQLGGLSQEYLEARRGYYGSSGGYASEYERVMGSPVHGAGPWPRPTPRTR